jgi:hypothetical protein
MKNVVKQTVGFNETNDRLRRERERASINNDQQPRDEVVNFDSDSADSDGNDHAQTHRSRQATEQSNNNFQQPNDSNNAGDDQYEIATVSGSKENRFLRKRQVRGRGSVGSSRFDDLFADSAIPSSSSSTTATSSLSTSHRMSATEHQESGDDTRRKLDQDRLHRMSSLNGKRKVDEILGITSSSSSSSSSSKKHKKDKKQKKEKKDKKEKKEKR